MTEQGMAVKVLVPGVLPKDKPSNRYTGTCDCCGCQVECSDDDLVVLSNWIRCPTFGCGNVIVVKLNNWRGEELSS
jgi:hypothetical protein